MPRSGILFIEKIWLVFADSVGVACETGGSYGAFINF